MTKLEELDEKLKSYHPTDKELEHAKVAGEQRAAFVAKFPIADLDSLTPEAYCIGHGDKENFCWWIERGTNGMSSYFPGSSRSYGMFWEKDTNSYQMIMALKRYKDLHPDADNGTILHEVIAKPLKALVEAHGQHGTFDSINCVGKSFLLKILILYYPDEFFQVNSTNWIDTLINGYGLEKPESYVDRNKVLRKFYEDKKKLVQGGELTQQAFVGVIARQLGIVRPRFWHMQLHPGSDSQFSQEDVLKILKQYGVVGMGETWDNDRGQPRQFAEDMHEGDVIGIREKGFVALVRVTGPCRKNDQKDELNWFDIVRPVEVLSEDAADYIQKYREETGKGAHDNLYNPATLREVTSKCKNKFLSFWYDSVMGMKPLRDDNPQDKIIDTDASQGTSQHFYTKTNFLQEVFVSAEAFDEMVSVLEKKKNIILTGAPGVGKTFAARRLAWTMMGERDDERVEFVQFHQSYAYEDFICGYKPSSDGGFELREGVFYTFCKKAENDPARPYFFIIDEINRGNISKIFGELLMLIEADKRGEQAYAVRLAYKPDERFTVPKNLYIIGLMNTADRSLAMMDYALRRRFCFVSMEPGFDSEGFVALVSGDDKMQRLVEAVKKLNEVIVADASLGKGFVIGHSFFCGSLSPEEIVRYDIGPTLDEYWFDNQSKADEERNKLLNAIR